MAKYDHFLSIFRRVVEDIGLYEAEWRDEYQRIVAELRLAAETEELADKAANLVQISPDVVLALCKSMLTATRHLGRVN